MTEQDTLPLAGKVVLLTGAARRLGATMTRATQAAASFKPDYMTNDKLEAATKGHGSLVIPVYCAANSLAEDVFAGSGPPIWSY